MLPRNSPAHRLGDPRQVRVERAAQCRDRVRQWMVEIPVASVSEAVAGHLDRRAEVLVVVEQVGELAALALAQQRRRDHVPVGVKLGRQIGPVEVVHPLVESTCRFAEVEHCFSFRLEGFRVHSPASVWFNDRGAA